MRLFLTALVILFTFTLNAFSEFSVDHHPDISISNHGNKGYHTLSLSGTYPLNFINGYIGAEWIHLSKDNSDNDNFIRARLEGGYNFGKLGIRVYGRYNSKTISDQDHFIHGGKYLNIKLVDKPKFKFRTGIGAWIAQEELSENYNIDNLLEYGPEIHCEFKIFNIFTLAEFLPSKDFDNYTIRIIPIWTYPVAKILFLDQISIRISGEIQYDSLTHHLKIDPWQWHWKNAISFGF